VGHSSVLIIEVVQQYVVYELQRRDSAFKFKDLSQRELLNRSKFLENGIILLCLSNYVREI